MRTTVLVVLLLAAAGSIAAQECPSAANQDVESGWELYRDGAIAQASLLFARARERCPLHVGARIGTGYAALRWGEVREASSWFQGVLASDSSAIDALVGQGLVEWQLGDEQAAREIFIRTLELEPGHEDVESYLDQLGRPPVRPRLVLPDTVVTWARTNGDRFEVLDSRRWTPFYIKGVNLGAALPGKHPSEFPDSLTYAQWIEQIGAMGANAIRVYTIHPPHFYKALAAYNRSHRNNVLWLIHGVWTELPPDHDFSDTQWNDEFEAEAQRVVDLLHGRADIMARPGNASGFYTADVSRWTLAYIIGREWEPFAVQAYDSLNADVTAFTGHYLSVDDGTATEVWMARVCDRMIAYETDTYRTQRPIAYTSWPTLDPLFHPTETSVAEELGIRGAFGNPIKTEPKEYDNDLVSLDPSLLQATGEFRAGVFASYHAYPYYPDFMVLGPGYADYLRRLKAHHRGMPVVIAEYGVPASFGIAHLEPQGWHHGGHSEAAMASVDAELTTAIAESGMAGGILFAWIDEWFKKNWVVVDMELPLERVRMWYSRMNAEEHYGVVAMEPESRLEGETVSERLAAWRDVPPVYPGRLRAFVDEAYLWLLVEPGESGAFDSVFVGLDIVDPHAGSVRWPNRIGSRLPVGLEFVVAARPEEVRVLADPSANPFRVRMRSPIRLPFLARTITPEPSGMFQGPFDQEYNIPMWPERSTHGRYDSLRVVTNRRRFTRDSTEYAATGYDRGWLRPGSQPDGFWERDPASGAIEIRVPWSLINVADPSARRVLARSKAAAEGFATEIVDAIRIALAARSSDGDWHQWPGENGEREAASFSWATWEEPRWRARVRPTFEAMQRVFQELDAREDFR
jgi:tetratricopeptide (TPR) repeat protein